MPGKVVQYAIARPANMTICSFDSKLQLSAYDGT